MHNVNVTEKFERILPHNHFSIEKYINKLKPPLLIGHSKALFLL